MGQVQGLQLGVGRGHDHAQCDGTTAEIGLGIQLDAVGPRGLFKQSIHLAAFGVDPRTTDGNVEQVVVCPAQP